MITEQETRGKWNQISGAVKEKYGQITDDDLSRVEGNTEQLVGLIQQKTGQTREQVEAFVRDCCHDENSWDQISSRASAYAGTAGESLRSGYQQVSDQARYGYDQSAQTVARHPVESVLTAFGVGLAAGIAIGMSIAHSQQVEQSWRRRLLS